MSRRAVYDRLVIRRLDPTAAAPLYLQLVNAIEEGIRVGQVRVGQRLPSERRLADQLDTSRTTVTNAYQELEARGLIRGHVGRGTVVMAAPTDANLAAIPWRQRMARLTVAATDAFAPARPESADVISLANGWPDPSLYPRDVLDAVLERVARRKDLDVYGPSPTEGEPELRDALSEWLGTFGIRTSPDQVLITAGAQEGLNLLARALLSPGDVALVERPTWPGAAWAFRWAGAEVIAVPVDEEGIQPDLLEEAFVRYRPKLLYLIPTFQNPTGIVLSAERRRKVLALAAQFRVPIIESDLYGRLALDGIAPPPLKALDDGGLVIYQGSLSKMVVPGLRVGWLVGAPAVVASLSEAKMLAQLCTATIPQCVAAEFLNQRHFDRHLPLLQRAYRARRDRMVSALHEHCEEMRFRVPAGGMYLWVRLPPSLRAGPLIPVAMQQGVAVRPGSEFTLDAAGDEYVRLCFAAQTPRKIVEGVRRLAEAVTRATTRREPVARQRRVAASIV